jgi:hypothetical protein
LKILKLLTLPILVAAPLFLGSCQTSRSDPDFVGTWQANISGEIITATFTTTTMHLSDTANGTADYSITSYDESAKHILTKVTGATGHYVEIAGAVGSPAYWLYSTSGNQIDFASKTSNYPTSVSGIVLIKQRLRQAHLPSA